MSCLCVVLPVTVSAERTIVGIDWDLEQTVTRVWLQIIDSMHSMRHHVPLHRPEFAVGAPGTAVAMRQQPRT